MKKKIAIVLGKGCNYRCSYCFEQGVDGSYKMALAMSDETVEKTIKFLEYEKSKLKDGEFIFLNLYGGEPLLFPKQATRFIEYARDNQMYVRFITNGSLIVKMTEQLLAWKDMLGSRLDYLISYDYALQEKNRCKGTYQTVRDGMLWMDRNGISFRTNTIFPVEDLDKFQEVFKDFLLLKQQLSFNADLPLRIGLDKIGCRKPVDYESVEQSLDGFKSILASREHLKKHITFRFGHKGGNYRKKSCGLGWRMLAGVDYDGTLYTCMGAIFHPYKDELKFGSVYDDISDVVQRREEVFARVVKPLPDGCVNCKNFCRVCAIDVYKTDGVIEESHCKIHRIVTKSVT